MSIAEIGEQFHKFLKENPNAPLVRSLGAEYYATPFGMKRKSVTYYTPQSRNYKKKK